MRRDNKPKFMNFTKLDSKKKAELIENLKNDYGCETDFLNDYEFYLTSKDKVQISKVNLDNENIERINSLGVYFGVFPNETRFRLSLEGSKFLKPTKNIIELNDKQILSSYLSAENLFDTEVKEIEFTDNVPFKIVQFEGENLGTVSHKEKEFLNYIPKSRKLDYNKLF